MIIIILIITSTQVLNDVIGKINLIGPYTSQSVQARNLNCSLIRQIAQIFDWSVLRTNLQPKLPITDALGSGCLLSVR